MKNLILLVIGFLLGVFGVAFYKQLLPWQRPSLDHIYTQTKNYQWNPDNVFKSTEPVDKLVSTIMSSENSGNAPNSSDTESKEFLQGAFEAMHTYDSGNNKFISGWKASIIKENGYGDVKELNLDNQIYEAKGYFEKLITDVDSIETNNSDTDHIKKLLIQAVQLRVDGISLISKGLLLKQERGQIRDNNMMQEMSENTASWHGGVILQQQETVLPSYNGEVEDGLAKLKIANTYFVEALNLLKTYSNHFPNDGTLTYPNFDDFINYYSDKSSSQ